MGLDSALIGYITNAKFISSFDEITANIWKLKGSKEAPIDPLLGMPDSLWFISMLLAGTDTRVLHQLALSINSSFICDPKPEASFLSPCSGSNHF